MKSYSMWGTMRHMLPFFPTKDAILVVMGSLIGAILEFCVAGSISMLGLAMAAPENLMRSPIAISILSVFSAQGDDMRIPMLAVMLGGVCLAIFCKNLFLGLLTWKSIYFSYEVAGCFAENIFQAFLRKPLIWHLQQNTSDLVTFMQWRPYVSGYCNYLLSLFTQGCIIIGLLVGSLYLAPGVSVVVFGGTALVGGLVYIFSRKRLEDASICARDIDTAINRLTFASLLGYKDIVLANKQENFVARMASLWPQQSRAQAFRAVYQPLPQWVLEFFGALLLLMALLILWHSAAKSGEVASTLMLLMGISWRILPATHKVLASVLGLRSVMPMMESMLPIANTLMTFNSELDAPKVGILQFDQQLEMNNLSFSYPDAADATLHTLCLTIPKGSMAGFVGVSGAGKSTLVNILSGLFIPTDGSFVVDGQPLDTEQARSAWMRHVGYVPQEPYMMDATIAENIAFSFWGGKIDRSRVERCCHMAAMDFIQDLPQGLDTQIGDKGSRLSGGQLQRIAIARALYSNPDIIIFDEATSSIDGGNEEVIRQTTLNLKGEVTLVVVAHRLSSLESCDMVYWLDNGHIRLSGTPQSVLPRYQAFLDSESTSRLCLGHSREASSCKE